MSKFEPSPAESLLSIPGDPYPSLFDNTALTPAAATTMSPLDIDVDMDMMTPQSFAEPEDTAVSPPTAEAEAEPSNMSSPAPGEKSTPGKKPAKKRKSWGQVLPQPKTNLPPRKRAKTEDEKEQRRVERVLRNRRAAQSSRERKRLEVEALETRNKELELTVLEQQKKLMALVQQLHRIGQSPAIVTSSPLDSIPETSLTLSKELFGSKDKLIASDTPPVTVNPASLSPNLVPVADSSEKVSPKKESVKKEPSTDAAPSEPTSSISPDLTQRPAAMLCDLPCHMSAEMPQSFLASRTSTPPTWAWLLPLQMMLLSASALMLTCHRPLTQIAISLKANFSLRPTPQLLVTIIWLITLPRTACSMTTTSTSTTTSTKTETSVVQNLWQRATSPLRPEASSTRCTTLRLETLRKILSSSPFLARPLMDATLVALRLVSEGNEDRVGALKHEPYGTRGDGEVTRYLKHFTLPSKEVLVTLLWALKIHERRLKRELASVGSETRCLPGDQQPTQKSLKSLPERKRRVADDGSDRTVRSRLS